MYYQHKLGEIRIKGKRTGLYWGEVGESDTVLLIMTESYC